MSILVRPNRCWFLLCAALLGACGSQEAVPTPNPKAQVVTGHAKAEPGAFEQKAFACCSEAKASAVVRAFSDLGATLAADDEAGAQQGADALATAMAAATFEGDAAPLADMAASLRTAKGLQAVREAYLAVSDPMLAYAKAQSGGTDRYAIAYCSMKPGRWLQSESELANPYYGSEMLRCGNFEAAESVDGAPPMGSLR